MDKNEIFNNCENQIRLFTYYSENKSSISMIILINVLRICYLLIL